MSETILVTGATGFIGRHLVGALMARGFSVRAALRRQTGAAQFGSQVAPIVVGDLVDEIDWGPALSGAAAVVHLAGIAHTGDANPEAAYDRVNRWAAVRLAEAARKTGARFIFISSVRAQSGPTATGVLTEESAPAPTDAYGRSKLAAELEITASGGRFVILRPTLVYGNGVGGNMGSLMRLARLPIPLPFGAVNNARSLLAVENLAAAIVLAITSDAALGGTFLVADAAPVSFAEVVTFLRAGQDRGPGLIPVPSAMIGGALKLIGQGAAWDRLSGDLAVSTARISRIGYAPVVDTRTALTALGAS